MSPGDAAFLLARSTQRPKKNPSAASHSSTAQTQPSFSPPAGAKILCCKMRTCCRASSGAVKPHSTPVPSLFSSEMSNVDCLIVSERGRPGPHAASPKGPPLVRRALNGAVFLPTFAVHFELNRSVCKSPFHSVSPQNCCQTNSSPTNHLGLLQPAVSPPAYFPQQLGGLPWLTGNNFEQEERESRGEASSSTGHKRTKISLLGRTPL